jgi:hypothetical protein
MSPTCLCNAADQGQQNINRRLATEKAVRENGRAARLRHRPKVLFFRDKTLAKSLLML